MSDHERAVFFRVREQEYALGVEAVERIVAYGTPNKIPDAPDYLLGLLRVEEETLPILDMSYRFFKEKTEAGEDHKILVVGAGGLTLGLLVEEVLGVFPAKLEAASQEERALFGPARHYLLDFVVREGRTGLLLDPTKIFDDMQYQHMEAILEEPEED